MKRELMMFSILLVLISTASAVSAYDASVDVLMDTLGPEDSLTIYGYVDHATGSETFYPTSSLKLRIYNANTGPSDSVIIKSSNINYVSDYENTGNLLLEGAFTVEDVSLSLTDGEPYSVELLINNELKAYTSFTYEEELYRNSTLSVPDQTPYIQLGTLKASYTIKKEDYAPDLIYDVGFYTPSFTNVANWELGNADETDTLALTGGVNQSRPSSPISISSTVLSEGMNIFVIDVTDTNASLPELIPESFVKLIRSGEPKLLPVSGTISLESGCSAKEEATKSCEFTVENTGDYPAVFTITTSSSINNEVSFNTNMMNAGESRTETISLRAVEGQAGTTDLTLTLKHGEDTINSVSQSVKVDSRDRFYRVNITDFDNPLSVMEDEEISATFEITNTGDFTERVTIKYTVNGREYTKVPSYTLESGESEVISIDAIRVPEDHGDTVSLGVYVEGDDITTRGRLTDVVINDLLYTPYTRWHSTYKNLEQGSTATNDLIVRNKGNTQSYYSVTVASEFASVDKKLLLNPGESEELSVDVLARDSSEPGLHTVEAEVCSLTSNECYSDDFELTIIEVEEENSTVTVNETVQELEQDSKGGVFEINVENNEGETQTYTLSTGEFEGDVEVSPGSLTLLDGGTDDFYLYAEPEQRMTQNLTYSVLKDDTVIRSGNLTLSYGTTGLTGLITLSEAGSIGAVILAMILITALVIWGVRTFNQSKVELKYWR